MMCEGGVGYVLPEVICVHTGRVRSVQRLPSNRREVLLLRAEQGEFVLKVCDASAAQWLFNESAVLREVSLIQASIAPRCILGATIISEKCYQLTEYLPSESLVEELSAGEQSNEPELIRQVATLLRKVHDLPIKPPEGFSTLDALLKVAEHNLRRNLLDPDEFKDSDPQQILDWLKVERPSNNRFVFWHGDYRPKNLLSNSRQTLMLIDWEHVF